MLLLGSFLPGIPPGRLFSFCKYKKKFFNYQNIAFVFQTIFTEDVV